MLKKINRLSRLKVNKIKQEFDSPLFRIKIFEDKGEEVEFGFIVSKKIDKRAVIRNKTKRVLKTVMRKILPEIKANKKMIIVAKTKIDFTKQEELENVARKVFKKAEVLK